MLRKLLTGYIIVSICLFLSLGYLVAEKSSASIKEELMNTANISLDESQRSIINMMNSSKDTALQIAANTTVQSSIQNFMSSGDSKYLEELDAYLDEYPGISNVYSNISIYMDTDAAADDYKHIESGVDEGILEAYDKPYRFFWQRSSMGDNVILRQLKAVYSSKDYKTILGVIAVDTNVDSIRSIAEAANSTGNRLYLVSDSGEIVYPHYNYDHISDDVLMHQESVELEIDDNLLLIRMINDSGWKLIKVISIAKINERSEAIKETIIFLTIAFACVSLLVAIVFISQFLKPVIKLSDKMAKVKAGDLEMIEEGPRGEVADLYDSYNYMIDRINKEIDSNYMSKIREKDSELKALQAQINPHFLYNTLDSINWMALQYGAKDISKMVLALSDMFRLSLNKGKNILSIKDEIRQVDSYITLQKERYSDSFDVKYEIDENIEDRKVLKMLLQPIVENAIIHGFESLEKDGIIIIKVKDMKDGTYFEVRNNGKLVDLETINKSLNDDVQDDVRKGYGIYNVNERIKALYGEEYGLQYSIDGIWTIASFLIPLETEYVESIDS